MRCNPVTVSRHTGHGPAHLDVVIAAGPRCPTLHADRCGWRWGRPHRRRYLDFRGPVAGGRGRIRPVWRGRIWWSAHRLRFVRRMDAGSPIVPLPAGWIVLRR